MSFVTYESLGQCGRLGNQLFQLAATIGHGQKYGLEVRIPKRERFFDDKGVGVGPVEYLTYGMDTSIDYLPEKYELHNKYAETSFGYNEIPKLEGNVSLAGYFQSYKYFSDYEDLVKKTFLRFNTSVQSQINDVATQLPYNKPLTAIHVRRGDYVQKQDYHTVLPLTYYEAAKKEIGNNQSWNSESGGQNYVVFSDDIKWCKKNFPEDHYFVESGNPFVDLGVMSCCDNFIIANSSFSWWGAWLSYNENKRIVAPKNWFGPAYKISTQDLIPKSWIQL